MKKSATLILLLGFFISSPVFSQSLVVSTYLEQTKMSPKIGTSIGYNITPERKKKVSSFGVEMGLFYQESLVEFKTAEVNAYQQPYENTFLGAYIEVPVIMFNNMTVDINVRTGTQNLQNFCISPSLKINYEIGGLVAIGAGVGSRSMQHTIMFHAKMRISTLQ